MKTKWESPRIFIQEFEANEYVAACWGVGCNWEEANVYEHTHKNDIKPFNCTHGADNCGLVANQVIKDYNNDGIADAMIETGTNNLGDLVCTIYTNEQYTTIKDISTVKSGDYIYWTTSASGGRVWHHQGSVNNTVPGHPNRS